MKKKIFLSLFFIILLSLLANAVDFIPQGDIDLLKIYEMKNATNVSIDDYLILNGIRFNATNLSQDALGDITAVNAEKPYILGGGSSGAVTIDFNESRLNLTIQAIDKTISKWPINTTVFQNKSGTLNILQSFWDGAYAALVHGSTHDGNGLSSVGNQLNVNVGTGLEIASDDVRFKCDDVDGDGLACSVFELDVQTATGIQITGDSVGWDCSDVAGTNTACTGEVIYVPDIWVDESGDTMTGDLVMSNNNIKSINEVQGQRFRFVAGNNASYIKVNDGDWIGANETVLIGNNLATPGTGQIVFLVYTKENTTNMWLQSGLNNSYSAIGNSFGLIPNTLGIKQFAVGDKVNLTELSKYPLICDHYNITCQFNADTGGEGPLLFTTGPLEVFRESRLHDTLIVEQGFDVIGLNGSDANIIGGPLHPRFFEIVEEGVGAGETINNFKEDFESGTLGQFTTTDAWTATVDAGQCPNNDPGDFCVGRTSTATNARMTATFSTSNFNMDFIRFDLNADLDGPGGNDGTITVYMNNNVGSGDVQIYTATATTVVDQRLQNAVPASMDNQPDVDVIFDYSSSNGGLFAYVDNVFINGTAIGSTLSNQSRARTQIKLLDGNNGCEIFARDIEGTGQLNISCDEIFFRGNASFTNQDIVSENATGNIEAENIIARDQSNATTFYEGGTSLVDKYVSRSDWTTHDNYPSACTGSEFVRGIGDTLTCINQNTLSIGASQITAGTFGAGEYEFQEKVTIDQDTDDEGLYIDSEATTPTNYGLIVETGQGASAGRFYISTNNYVDLAREANSFSSGTSLFLRDLADASTLGPVVRIEQENAGDSQDTLQLQQDGTDSDADALTILSIGGGKQINGLSFDVDASGNVATPQVTFTNSGDIYDNTTCTVINSPNGLTVLSICN